MERVSPLMETLQEIARHKTAIGRGTLSRPIKLALADGIVTEGIPLFDYGCGRGDDVRILGHMGFECVGWDPVHRPAAPGSLPPSSISAMS